MCLTHKALCLSGKASIVAHNARPDMGRSRAIYRERKRVADSIMLGE